MSTYRPVISEPAEIRNARWLCPGCGDTKPIEGPAYPVCECGSRARFVTLDGQPYVVAARDEA